MCYANYTQHSGCSHIALSASQPLTLCDAAINRLYSLRGPSSPPITPNAQPFTAPPKRSASRRRFFSLSGTLSRSASSASRSRNANEGLGRTRSVRSTAGSFTPSTTLVESVDVGGLPEHEVRAVRCGEVVRRSVVAGEMSVCEGCRGAVEAMRSMVERWVKVLFLTFFSYFLEWDLGWKLAGLCVCVVC